MEELLKELWKSDEKHYQELAKIKSCKDNNNLISKKLFIKDIIQDRNYLYEYVVEKIKNYNVNELIKKL